MQLGMIGVGRMGANIVRRLVADGHRCVVHDVDAGAAARLASESSSIAADDLDGLVAALDAPRAVWVMVPAAVAGATIAALGERLDPGDTIIDGGNSYYRDDIDRSAVLAAKGIDLVDVGTSGGVHGLDRGYCLMVGGPEEAYRRLEPIFATLAPGLDAAPRTDPDAEPSTAELGYLHCGPTGAGHFVKMVHNGIEYGLMAAYAEGIAILRGAGAGRQERAADAETSPLREPQYYQYDLDVAAVTEVWRRGSVVASWLLDLTAHALAADPELEGFSGRVSDSGEGRWTVQAAVDEGVPAHVLTAALYERFSSRGHADFADRVLSALRHEFGGHREVPLVPDVAEPWTSDS